MIHAAQLFERASPLPDQTRPRGVYADYSDWPERVKFYAKCPKCGKVHGDYHAMREAHRNRMCQVCSRETIDKIKKEIELVDDPEHKTKPLGKLLAGKHVKEALDDPAAESDYDPDLDSFGGAKGEMFRLLTPKNWIDGAMMELSRRLQTPVGFSDTARQEYDPNFPEDGDSIDKVYLTSRGREWTLYRDEEIGREEAIQNEASSLQSEPSAYDGDWLRSKLDSAKLAAWLGDEYEEWEHDIHQMYDEDLAKMLIEKGYLDTDDYAAADEDGQYDLREAAKDEYIANEKPKERDPWDRLEELYGDKALKHALEGAGQDIDWYDAAKQVVRDRGWLNDRESIHLENGAVAVRTG